MRYLLITFIKKADGTIDEQVQVSTTVRPNDTQTCNLILDFKEKAVVKCVVESQVLNTSWDTITEYYNRIYPAIIERLTVEAPNE